MHLVGGKGRIYILVLRSDFAESLEMLRDTTVRMSSAQSRLQLVLLAIIGHPDALNLNRRHGTGCLTKTCIVEGHSSNANRNTLAVKFVEKLNSQEQLTVARKVTPNE